MINLALCGLGRAGTAFVDTILKSEKYNLTLVVAREESKTVGMNVGEVLNVLMKKELIIKKIEDVTEEDRFDILVDFSNGETTVKLVEMCRRLNKKIVICPTNFTKTQIGEFKKTGKEIGIVFAPTLTIGINLLIDFAKKVSALFPQFEFEIVERHGKQKARPTATSKIIANEIEQDKVQISSVRLDGYIGIHEVTATNGNERISVIHESLSRNAFVEGALLAASFIKDKIGYFEMKDIINSLIKDYHESI